MHDVKRSSLRRRLRPLAGANVLKYCFLLPAVVWIVAFSIFPLLSAFHFSFANYVLGRGITGYVGFANYINVLGSGTFWYSLFITVVYVSIAVPVELVLGFLLAWLVTLSPPGFNWFRSLLTAPLFTMEVAIGYLGITLFTSQGGLLPGVLSSIGVQIPWLSTTSGGLAAAIILDVWRWTPFVFLISLAGLSAFPDEMYEAALLESSDYWQLMVHIAVPLSWPVVSWRCCCDSSKGSKALVSPWRSRAAGRGPARNYSACSIILRRFSFSISVQAWPWLYSISSSCRP